MARKHKRQEFIQPGEIRVSFMPEEPAVFEVEMTNGSGVERVVMTGRQSTVWAWCCRAGETPESNLAGFVPVAIKKVAEASPEVFEVVA
jgi:hypothetical protein